ncbi:MAG: UvrD-helicase domain-containing protein, partial [Oscillospiraceae bacterium]|nr:UvrD-helicase domain-containing protein [Oscillospiraceae bacterium]
MDFYSEFLALRKQYIEKRFSALNPEQRRAALSSSGAALVLAGAGSGKTTVIVNRILCLLEFGSAYDTDEVCYTPTEEDVAQLRACVAGSAQPDERLRRMLHAGSVKPWNILAITFTNKAAAQL